MTNIAGHMILLRYTGNWSLKFKRVSEEKHFDA